MSCEEKPTLVRGGWRVKCRAGGYTGADALIRPYNTPPSDAPSRGRLRTCASLLATIDY